MSDLKILLVDDEPNTCESQAFVLEQSSATVTAVASGFEVLQALDQFIPDLLDSDVGMAEIDSYHWHRLNAYLYEIDSRQIAASVAKSGSRACYVYLNTLMLLLGVSYEQTS